MIWPHWYRSFRPLSGPTKPAVPKASPPATPPPARYAIFSWDFDWSGAQDIHWHQPSSLVVFNDGSWLFHASHLANKRRSMARDDIGAHRTYLAALTYRDASERTIGAAEYSFYGLDYGKDAWNISITNTDEFVKANEAQIASATCTQWLR
jgi:hypothetical protein